MKTSSSVRKPAFSGRFYPGSPLGLKELIECFLVRIKACELPFRHGKILGGIVPHAGYIYSGYIAMHFFALMSQQKFRFDTAIVVCPNHAGTGPEISLDGHDYWETPLGNVKIDQKFNSLLGLEFCSEAHKYEHSAEVLVPMLQYFFNENFSLVPVCMWKQTPEAARLLASRIASAKKDSGRNILVIASSDFTHYENPEFGAMQDNLALEKILAFDVNGLARVINMHSISMCGSGPAMVLMELAMKFYQQPAAQILASGHSGQVAPSDKVVRYVSVCFGEAPA
ncbi:MAG TPA: AmmeMemoRadiSam system protein B [Bacteroidales bacterium]|nr:AmmeMemoRadiSam system protein B [Bacteroidales bacterium]